MGRSLAFEVIALGCAESLGSSGYPVWYPPGPAFEELELSPRE
jgi:hypothetical protein